ncbi:hypothetical protein DPMN_150737, partial [Dreissena polymorpha]
NISSMSTITEDVGCYGNGGCDGNTSRNHRLKQTEDTTALKTSSKSGQASSKVVSRLVISAASILRGGRNPINYRQSPVRGGETEPRTILMALTSETTQCAGCIKHATSENPLSTKRQYFLDRTDCCHDFADPLFKRMGEAPWVGKDHSEHYSISRVLENLDLLSVFKMWFISFEGSLFFP